MYGISKSNVCIMFTIKITINSWHCETKTTIWLQFSAAAAHMSTQYDATITIQVWTKWLPFGDNISMMFFFLFILITTLPSGRHGAKWEKKNCLNVGMQNYSFRNEIWLS